jgi:hypothetical protein
MNGTATRLARREIVRAVGPEVINTLNKQGAAIAQLSEDIREAFQQQNDKIRELIKRVEELEAR